MKNTDRWQQARLRERLFAAELLLKRARLHVLSSYDWADRCSDRTEMLDQYAAFGLLCEAIGEITEQQREALCRL